MIHPLEPDSEIRFINNISTQNTEALEPKMLQTWDFDSVVSGKVDLDAFGSGFTGKFLTIHRDLVITWRNQVIHLITTEDSFNWSEYRKQKN